MRKSHFLAKLWEASNQYGLVANGKNDTAALAAQAVALPAIGDSTFACPITSAVMLGFHSKDDPLRAFAEAEKAWEYVQETYPHL